MRAGFCLGVFLLAIFSSGMFSRSFAGDEAAARKEKTSGLAWMPVVYYTPETKWALGAGGLYYFRPTKDRAVARPSNIAFVGIYTQRRQLNLMLNPDLYLSRGLHLQWTLEYSDFPDYFYGIGRNTREDDEELFTSKFWELRLEALKQVSGALNLGVIYFFDATKLTDVSRAPLLAAGDVPGSGGGTVSGVGSFVTYDSRDSIFFPTNGSYHQWTTAVFGRAIGSDFSFKRVELDLRKYVPVARNHTLALQSRVLLQTGDPPFWRLGLLGGDKNMRGYYLGRYRDKNMIVLQAEYRWVPVVWRLGLVAFAGIGDVADRIGNFEPGKFRYSYGLGLRYIFDKRQFVTLRLDVGFGQGTSGIYFTAVEAF